jgi:ubiquinone/menaquinone biosynthesis C-methylase UbiE
LLASFFYQPLQREFVWKGSFVADLACGSGHNSLALRGYFPSIHTTGNDIAEEACRDYRANTGAVAHLVDLTKPDSPDQSHDTALVIGGLHHCVMDLSAALKNVASIVRPGGHFMMMEPSDDSFLKAFGVSGIEGLRLIPDMRSSMTNWLQQQRPILSPRRSCVSVSRLLSYPQ